jgi:hypothetical protein
MTSTIILTVLLFFLPVFFFSIKSNVFSNISLKSLTLILNKALLIQIFEGLILMFISKSFGHELGHSENLKFPENLILETNLYFVIIGLFNYLPFVIILNFINFINLKLRK